MTYTIDDAIKERDGFARAFIAEQEAHLKTQMRLATTLAWIRQFAEKPIETEADRNRLRGMQQSALRWLTQLEEEMWDTDRRNG